MKLLLDTHLLLWAGKTPEKLTARTRALLTDAENDLHFSTVSLWEVAIKRGTGKQIALPDPRLLRRALLENGYIELQITGDHVVAIDDLPFLHKDPFDRLLIAQARVEGITLLTADSMIARYPGPIRKV